jgi:hypothetical protein
MNLLIVGGLLILGLLAILGAAFLARGEKGVEGIVKKPALTPAPGSAEMGEAGQEPVVKDVGMGQNLPVPQEEAHIAMLNGQFHELAEGLRSLYQESQELERRLNLLVKIANHMEYVQRDHVSVEEERDESQ